MQGIYIALGTNLGDRLANLRTALQRLAEVVDVEAVSPVYETAPQPPAPPPAYYNAVCRVRTTLRPDVLLSRLKGIEAGMGRRPAEHWAPRVIDLDLLLYNDEHIDAPGLQVPHPRMLERPFVMGPLHDLGAEVAVQYIADPPLVRVVDGDELTSRG